MGKLEKISAWNLTKVKSKKQVIDEARASGATVHFASLMDICHLKKLETSVAPAIQDLRVFWKLMNPQECVSEWTPHSNENICSKSSGG